MVSFLFGLFFVALMLLGISLERTYSHYPPKELKRRARHGEPLAQTFYTVVGYGVSLRVFLWAWVIIFAAAAFVCISNSLTAWLAVVVIAFFLWLGFLWLPHARISAFSETVARRATPTVAWIVRLLDPLLRRIGNFVRRHRYVHFRTQLYEKEDVLELLEKQQHQPDNRIPVRDIKLARHALQFTDKQVADIVVPKRVVKRVAASDAIGPKLMDELYKSGYSRFPVYEDNPDHIIATLYLKDLVRRASGGHVRDAMRADVYYVHEDFALPRVLHAFLKTKHHLFVVVNKFEEFVGIVTIEDVLEQIIGEPIVDEFDAYDDMRAVAAADAKKEHSQQTQAKTDIAAIIEE